MTERRFLSPFHERELALVHFLYGDAPGAGPVRDAGGRWPRGAPRGARGALAVVAAAQARLVALRGALAHVARARLAHPVLAVGNLGLGGSGKTPFVRWLAAHLRAAGHAPAVLTRGYGWVGRTDVPLALLPGDPARLRGVAIPDEAQLFLRDGVPVGAHPVRARAATALARAGARPDVYVLDDGFQHRQLAREWDLVLVSRRELDGPRLTVPAGPLRESWPALARASRIAVTGLDPAGASSLGALTAAELGLPAGEPSILAGLVWLGAVELGAWQGGGDPVPAAAETVEPTPATGAAPAATGPPAADPVGGPPLALADRPLVAFSGIADPASFERLLASRRIAPALHVVLPDHHRYDARDLERLAGLVPAGGGLITTEKDAARLPADWRPSGGCWVVRVGLALWRGEETVVEDLARLGLRAGSGAASATTSGAAA